MKQIIASVFFDILILFLDVDALWSVQTRLRAEP